MKPLSAPNAATPTAVNSGWLDLLEGRDGDTQCDLGSRIRRLAELAAAVHAEAADREQDHDHDQNLVQASVDRLMSDHHQAAGLIRAVADREAA